jgi:hypothetical protein
MISDAHMHLDLEQWILLLIKCRDSDVGRIQIAYL